MPILVKEARKDHNLDDIQGSRQYFTRIQRRMKRHQVTNKDDMDWKKDAEEYAHQIWE